MIEIDGSQGEGGGQIVRSSLALSLLTGKAIRISRIRAGRKRSGLKQQHLIAVKSAAHVGCATVAGVELGSSEITFEPDAVNAGDYRFEIATAGSATLVLQTVLPALMLCEQESTLHLCGRTHNPMAPSFDFVASSFVPVLNSLGPSVELELIRHGFYPAGGGEFKARISPAVQMRGREIVDRGKLIATTIHSIVSQIPLSVAKRETDRVARKLNLHRTKTVQTEVDDPRGPGNILIAKLRYENVAAMFCSFGKIGVSAERVADQVVRLVKKYLKNDAPIGPHLADQILLPMAIAAWQSGSKCRFRTMPLTNHTKTQIDVIKTFIDIDISNEIEPNGNVTISVG